MDLSYSRENEAFRQEVRAFLGANWPLADTIGDERAKKAEFRRRATVAGYLFRAIPREYGGSGQEPDFLKGEIIREEFKRAEAPREPVNQGLGRIIPVLLAHGSEEQKQRWIPPTVRNEIDWCQGYSEPNAGSDLASVRTNARLQGGKWIINGQKIWSSFADRNRYMAALIRTEPDDVAPRHQGISFFLLDLHQPGVEVRPIKQMTGDSEFCEVFFNDAEAPEDAVIGGRGNGWAVSRTNLRFERAAFSSINWVDSLIRRLVMTASSTVRDGEPMIADKSLRIGIARLQAKAIAMRYSAYRDLSLEAAGEPSGDYTQLQKLYLTDLCNEMDRLTRDLLADDYLLVSPGKGNSEDGLKGNFKWIEHSIQSLKIAIGGGPSNIQRNVIGERVLGLPRDGVGVNAAKKEPEPAGDIG
jgi:alkylation response protein AidB-like acyl-CoA dehydrogenase